MIDRARIRYHFVFAELRIAVLAIERAGHAPSADADIGSGLIYGTLHTRLTAEALAAATGTMLPAVPDDPTVDSDATPYFDAVLEQLRTVVVPAIDDPFASQRAKSAARVLKYLREVERAGAAPVVSELDELERVLGSRPATVDDGRRRLEEQVVAGTRPTRSACCRTPGRGCNGSNDCAPVRWVCSRRVTFPTSRTAEYAPRR